MSNIESNELIINSRKMTDERIKHILDLKENFLSYLPTLTDEGIQHLYELTFLYLCYNPNIADKEIKNINVDILYKYFAPKHVQLNFQNYFK